MIIYRLAESIPTSHHLADSFKHHPSGMDKDRSTGCPLRRSNAYLTPTILITSSRTCLTQSEIVKGNQQRLQGIAGVFLCAIATEVMLVATNLFISRSPDMVSSYSLSDVVAGASSAK
jgi:hypothetical protein